MKFINFAVLCGHLHMVHLCSDLGKVTVNFATFRSDLGEALPENWVRTGWMDLCMNIAEVVIGAALITIIRILLLREVFSGDQ